MQGSINFILLPLYIAYLSPAEYGIIGVTYTIINLLSIVYTLYLSSAATRFYFNYRGNEKKVKELFGTIFVFVALNALILTFIIIFSRNIFLSPFLKGIQFYPYIFLGLFIVGFNSLNTLFFFILQAKQRSREYGITNVIFVLCSSSLIVIFLVLFHWKAVGVLLASLIANILFFIYISIVFISKITLRINKKMLTESLKYSLPLIPHSLSAWATISVNKIIINNLKSTSAVGLYDVGSYIGGVVDVFRTAINQAYVPWFFEEMKSKRTSNVIKFIEFAALLYGCFALILSLFGKDFLSIIVSEKFREAWRIIPFISFAYVFYGIYYLFIATLLYDKKYNRYVLVFVMLSATVNIILNLLLIPQFGIVGSSIATLISMFIMSLCVLFISSKLLHIVFNPIKIYLFIAGLFTISLINFFEITPSLMFFSLKLTVVFILLMGIYLLYRKDFLWFFAGVMRATKIEERLHVVKSQKKT